MSSECILLSVDGRIEAHISSFVAIFDGRVREIGLGGIIGASGVGLPLVDREEVI